MPCGWEGNRRSGVALATRHRHQWFSTYGFKAWKEIDHPPTFSCGAWLTTFPFTLRDRRVGKELGTEELRTIWYSHEATFPGRLEVEMPASQEGQIFTATAVTFSQRCSPFSCIHHLTGGRCDAGGKLVSCGRQLRLCTSSHHLRTAELVRQVHGGGRSVEAERRLQAKMSVARHDPCAVELVVEVQVAVVWAAAAAACRATASAA